MSSNDKLARAQALIEEKKKQLSERIQKVMTTQQNQEKKQQQRQKELEKQRKEIEKWRKEKGFKPKKPPVDTKTELLEAESDVESPVTTIHEAPESLTQEPSEQNSTPEVPQEETSSVKKDSDSENDLDRSFQFEIASQMKLIQRGYKQKSMEFENKKQNIKHELLKAFFHNEFWAEEELQEFQTFGNQEELKQILEEAEQKPSKTQSEDEDSQKPKLLVFENESRKDWSQIKTKKLQQLQQRQTERTPERKPNPPSRDLSPKHSVLSDQTKQAIASKYRRHKNLPNLVYTKPSNRKLIKNAISQVCLAGEPNRGKRQEVLELIDQLPEVLYFIIVFKSELGKRDMKALYSHDTTNGEVAKVWGAPHLPELLESTMVKVFFRYDSGAREFKPLQCKDFIIATDAVALNKIPKLYS